jgi:hypothetical protein
MSELIASSLGNGLRLKKLEAQLTYWDLLAAGSSGFKEYSILEPVAAGCSSEIQSKHETASTPGYDTLNRAWLVSALLSLRGFTRHLGLAASAYSWNTIAGHHERNQELRKKLEEEGIPFHQRPPLIAKVPEFNGSLLDFHLKLILGSTWRKDAVTSADATWITDVFETANRLSTDQQFHFALTACTDWRLQADSRAAIARLWSGIEAILDIDNELSFRIAIVSASLLEPRGQGRLDRFQKVRRLYDLRSKAVHGGRLRGHETDKALTEICFETCWC